MLVNFTTMTPAPFTESRVVSVGAYGIPPSSAHGFPPEDGERREMEQGTQRTEASAANLRPTSSSLLLWRVRPPARRWERRAAAWSMTSGEWGITGSDTVGARAAQSKIVTYGRGNKPNKYCSHKKKDRLIPNKLFVI